MNASFITYNNDCITQMQKMPAKFINMIFADPPYFLSTGKERVKIKDVYTTLTKEIGIELET